MSKSILLIDTPESCVDCEFVDCDANGWFCGRTNKEICKNEANDKRPDWCPLQDLPRIVSTGKPWFICISRKFGLRKEHYMNNKAKYNGEGYADPTAYGGMKEVIREENENDKRAFDLVKMLKYIIKLAGFELIERVQLRDTKSGKEYK